MRPLWPTSDLAILIIALLPADLKGHCPLVMLLEAMMSGGHDVWRTLMIHWTEWHVWFRYIRLSTGKPIWSRTTFCCLQIGIPF